MGVFKRKSLGEPDSEKSRKKHKSIPLKPSPASLLKAEEPAFPRGGASVLTPLEHKQIRIQATRDVLFEQRTGNKPTQIKSDVENESDEFGAPPAPQLGVSQRSKTKTKPKKDGKVVEEPGVRIEGLSYKVRRATRLPRIWLK